MVLNRTMEEEDRFITSHMLEYSSFPWTLFQHTTLSRQVITLQCTFKTAILCVCVVFIH
jgi:hypothetical protein